MRLPVILTAYYGLRRIEVLGLKWDAIDYSEKKIVIRHKIIEVNTPNGKGTRGMDVLKTKSSYRTLPLIPYIEEVLNEEKARQARQSSSLLMVKLKIFGVGLALFKLYGEN